MTQLEQAAFNRITPVMRQVASLEEVPSRVILQRIREGKAVIPHNKNRKIRKPCVIGHGLRTKINANLGTSTDKSGIAYELQKLSVAVRYGADTVMDLSVGGDISKIRREILAHSPVPVGTVPIYEIAVSAQKKKRDLLAFAAEDALEVLESQAKEGVDFFTIHAGVTTRSLAALKAHRRVLGIVSRGGAILAAWIKRHRQENPFYSHFDRVLDIARRYDVTLSLGDGLRPGSVLDATDQAQLSELRILGELSRRCRKNGVQVMIEGPGHVPLHQIRRNMELEKEICHGAPFYVLGPLVTDVGSGYDHINGAIGAALAASYGADFLCYVTGSEHLRLPSVEDVKEGVVASRIAAHAADIVKGIPSALRWDREMSMARKRRDWKTQIRLSIDPSKARLFRKGSKPSVSDACTMCGRFCSIKLMEECLA